MTTTTLKNRIKAKIDKIKSEELLQAIYVLLDEKEEYSYELTSAQKKELDKRIALHKTGQSKSSSWEDVKKRIKKTV